MKGHGAAVLAIVGFVAAVAGAVLLWGWCAGLFAAGVALFIDSNLTDR